MLEKTPDGAAEAKAVRERAGEVRRRAHKEMAERAAMHTHDPLNACASDNVDGEVCLICQDTLSSDEGASAQLAGISPCNEGETCRHRFHADCLNQWFAIQRATAEAARANPTLENGHDAHIVARCPTCRTQGEIELL